MPDHMGAAEQLGHGQALRAAEVAQDVEGQYEVVGPRVRGDEEVGLIGVARAEIQHLGLMSVTTEGGGGFVPEQARAAILRLALDHQYAHRASARRMDVVGQA